MSFLLEKITANAVRGDGASNDEALFLARECSLSELMSRAERIREHFFGNAVRMCAIINARAGACSEDCRFCAQSARYKTGAPTYPLLHTDKLVRAAKRAADSGAGSFGIVTSGPSVKEDELEQIGAAIRAASDGTGSAICVSPGRLEEKQLLFLKSRGLTYYHHNLETSESFYPSICTTHEWAERPAALQAARRAGLKTCSGGLFGMGETWEDRISLALTLRDLEVDSVPINFLHPIPGTPLGDRTPLSPEEGLRIIALFRFILPKTTIRICGGRIATFGARQNEIFQAGANALMTGDYLTTTGVDPAADRAMIEKQGLILSL